MMISARFGKSIFGSTKTRTLTELCCPFMTLRRYQSLHVADLLIQFMIRCGDYIFSVRDGLTCFNDIFHATNSDMLSQRNTNVSLMLPLNLRFCPAECIRT